MKQNVLILFLMWPSWAASQGMKVSGELVPLLERAGIEGRAATVLSGEVAAQMRERGIGQPVEVRAQRLHGLKDPHCARLKVSFDQRQVILPNETMPRDRHAEFALNWCEGGRPPASQESVQPANQDGRP